MQKRRRLALFAEKNPNPVLRLSLDGNVRYANPAAGTMLTKIGLDLAAPGLLLPPDLKAKLARMREGTVGFERWEYETEDRTLGCGIQYLPRHRMFHAYITDVTERNRAEQKLIRQAYHDALSGLPNRRRFQELLEQALSEATDDGRCAVLLLNLDRFGLVNGSLGHVVGDRLLRSVAERLQRSIEECRGDGCVRGTLFRFESDTFCVLMTGLSCGREPITLAERIADNMAEPFYTAGHEFFVTASIGISVFPSDGEDAVALVQKADMALQFVKRRGGNGHQCYTGEMDARAADRLAMENGLRRALELKELSLHYQSQVEISSGRVIGAEVLLRWTSAERGPVSPAVLIPVAEETGLIVPIGEWVLRNACRQHRAWRERDPAAGVVAVNISARQFHHPAFTRMVSGVLAESGLDARYLELEITESVAMQNAEVTIATLCELKAMGVKLSIDDFGTGYSSLSYLKRFPIDKLKVDQSFVHNMTEDANDAAIARAVISLGHSLNLQVIAEGVETREHLLQLRQYGCDEIQGYLFSKPLTAADMTALLVEGRRLQVADGSPASALRLAAA